VILALYAECRGAKYASYNLWKTTESECFSQIFTASLIKQVASNKLSLLLEIRKQNTLTLQLFTKIIKMEIIYRNN